MADNENIRKLGDLDNAIINKDLMQRFLDYSMEKSIIDPGINQVLNEHDALFNKIRKAQMNREKYAKDVLDTLKNIESNTANLTTIVNLIHNNNEKQNEIVEIITELLNLAKENNKAETESKFRKIMNKITTFTEDIETIVTLMSFAMTVYNVLKGL